MAYTKYSLTPANNTAAPPDGAPEGMLPSAVNDTMRDMMAQIRDVGDGVRDGTYTMTAPKITGGTITGAAITSSSYNGTVGATTASTGAFTTLGATGNTSLDGGTFVFNDSGADKDFRIEGDTDANLFFTDASADRIGIGTSSPATKLNIENAGECQLQMAYSSTIFGRVGRLSSGNYEFSAYENGANLLFGTTTTNGSTTERMRIDSSGNLLVGKTVNDTTTNGCNISAAGRGSFSSNGQAVGDYNRTGDDGVLVNFLQDGTIEGTISVSGSTVSYNGGHLSRWSQWQNQSGQPNVYRGTVLESTNDMCQWNQANEQSTKTIVSNTEKAKTVAGVFDMYDFDDKANPNDFYVAQSGDFVIRIAQGVVVQNGDLLESAGDGTARPQTDDICRSSTIAKVTSNYVSTTYADGSFCVPCILMIG